MGLDITAYSNLKPLSCPQDEDGEPLGPDGDPLPYNSYTQPYVNPDFPGRCTEFEDRKTYEVGVTHGFRAGSYTGYSLWRDELARLAGYPVAEREQYGEKVPSHSRGAWNSTAGPFFELINFSDCEGTIGTAVSQKLARDFAEFRDRALNFDSRASYFWERYQEWQRAFELASDGGCVCFH